MRGIAVIVIALALALAAWPVLAASRTGHAQPGVAVDRIDLSDPKTKERLIGVLLRDAEEGRERARRTNRRRDGDRPREPDPRPPKADLDRVPGAADGPQRSYDQRRRRREGPQAEEARLRSRTAHRGLGRADALRLAREAHGEFVSEPAWTPFEPDEGERVIDYRGDFSAVVERRAADGELAHSLMESTLPLRSSVGTGEPEPVDLTLREGENHYATENPLVRTKIAKSVAQGIEFPEAGIALRAGLESDDATVADGKVFFANVDRDADLLVAPEPRGVELAWQLRSEESPERLPMRLDLPQGAVLRIEGRVRRAEVVQGEDVVATLSPPTVVDADGEPVKARYEADGHTLAVAVAHRDADVAYPLLVDPIIEAHGAYPDSGALKPEGDCSGWWSGSGWKTWVVQGSYFYFGEHCEGVYVYQYHPGGSGDWAHWYQVAPSRAYFERFELHASHHNAAWGTCLYEGGWSNQNNDWEWGRWYHPQPFTPPTWGGYQSTSPWMREGMDWAWDPNFRGDGCAKHHFNYKDHYPNAPTRTNAVLAGLRSNGGDPNLFELPGAYSLIRSARLFLNDFDTPYVTSVTHDKPTAWVHRATPGVASGATEPDPGLGVVVYGLYYTRLDGSLGGEAAWRGCYASRQERGDRWHVPLCWEPPSYGVYMQYDTDDMEPDLAGAQPLPEGVRELSLIPYDAVFKTPADPPRWNLRIDRSPPEALGLGGDVHTRRGQWFAEGVHPLALAPRDQYSGVKTEQVLTRNEGDRPSSDVVRDQFERSSSSGWGGAERGGPWSVVDGPESDYTIAGGEAKLAANDWEDQFAELPQSRAKDFEATFKVRLPIATSGSASGRLAFRRQPGDAFAPYNWIGLTRLADGRINIDGHFRGTRGSPAPPLFPETDTGLRQLTDELLQMRVRVVGSNIKARAWRPGQAEPTGWMVDANTTTGPQDAGAFGIFQWHSTGLRRTFGYDDLVVRSLDTNVSKDWLNRGCDAESGCPTQPGARTYSWDTRDYQEGSHEFRVKAADPIGSPDGGPSSHLSEETFTAKLDRTKPRVDNATGALSTPDRWLRPGTTYELGADTSDNLSGVQRIDFYVNGQLHSSQPGDGCSSAGCATDPPAKPFAWRVPSDYATAFADLQLVAVDAAGNASTPRTWRVNVDRHVPTAPVISGTLRSARNKAVRGSSFGIRVEGADGSTATPSSGVRQIGLWTGPGMGSLAQRLSTTAQECPQSNCRQTLDTSFSPGAADESRVPRRIRVRVADQVGHATDSPPQHPSRSAHWRLDEASGTQARDSRAANDGTYAGGFTLDQPGGTPDGGRAVKLDGASGRITTSYNPFANGSVRTFEGWAQRTDTSGVHTLVGGSASSRAPILYLPLGNTDVVWYSDVGAGQVRWPNAAPTGAWFHWAFVFDEANDRAELFVNGVSRGVRTVTFPYNAAPGNFTIGAYAGAGNPFKGSLDEVSVYGRGLSAAEIAQLHSPDPEDWRIAHWRLNETAGTIAADTAAHGELVGNGSFETNTSGWITNAGFVGPSTLTRVADGGAPDGAHVAKVVTDAVSHRGIGTDVTVKAGQRYRIRVRVKREAGGSALRIAMGEVAAPHEELLLIHGAAPGASGYTEYTGTVTPARSGEYRLYIRSTNSIATTFYVDGASLVEDNAGNYTGGYTLDQAGATGDGDRAVKLNGSTGHVDLPLAFNPTGAFSIEARVRLDALGGDQTIVSQRDGGGTGRTLLFVQGTSATFASNLGGSVRDSGVVAQPGRWYHVALTYSGGSGGTWTFYVDGAQTASGTATAEPATGRWYLGVSKLLSPGTFWNGLLDDVGVYPIALGAADVSRLASEHVYDWNVVFDNEVPRLDAPDPPSETAWRNGSTSLNVKLTGHDAISGVKLFRLFTPKAGGGEDVQTRTDASCSTAITRLCPTDPPGTTLSYSTAGMPEGSDNTVRAVVEDPVGHVSGQRTWKVKVDRTAPRITGTRGSLSKRDGRIRRGANDLVVDTGDTPSGVQRVEAFVDDADSSSDPRVSIGRADCTNAAGCPSLTGSFAWNSTDGPARVNVRVVVTDQVGNTVTDDWTVAHDDNPPVLELTGDMRPPIAHGRSVHIKATDDRAADTGVRKIEVWLDPDADPSEGEAQHVHRPDCSTRCPASTETDWALPAGTPEGRHTILIKATDDVDRTDEERYDVHVVDLLPSSRSKLGLEHWFDYDETGAGGDSKVYVNGETGNTVWHTVPIVNPGRGLSTVVNLTYNSHDRGGILGSTLGRIPIVDVSGQDLARDLPGLSHAEAGVGFSLGISGPTRLNEPLGGVAVAQAVEEGLPIPGHVGPLPGESNLVVTMTDSDGTVHTFTKSAGGGWVSPPGVNMRLRRYRDGGSFASPVADKWAMTRPDGVTHFFDNLGYLTETRDRNANSLIYHYEHYDALTGDLGLCDGVELGKRTEVELPDGTEVPVFCAKRVDRVTDPGGRDLTIDYHDHGDTLLGLADGQLPVEFGPDFPGLVGGRAGRIERITDHARREYRFEYDQYGYLTRLTEAANHEKKRVTELAYEDWAPGLEQIGQDRQLASIREGETGRKTVIRHVDPADRSGFPVPGVIAAPRQACGVTKRNDGESVQVSNPVSGQECRTARSDLEKTYDYAAPEGGGPRGFEVTEVLMRAHGATASSTTARTRHELDGRGRPTALVDPNGIRTALTWNEDENAVSSVERASGTDAASRTELTYDGANHTGVVTEQRTFPSDGETRVTRFAYQFSNGTHHSSAANVADEQAGRFVADLTEVQNPRAVADSATGSGQSFVIEQRGGDYTGNVIQTWDRPGRQGNVATTAYNPDGTIRSEDDEVPENGPTVYERYDPNGLPRTVFDPRGKQWDYLYDEVGNVTSVIDPRAPSPRAGGAGEPYTTTLEYDPFDRLVSERIPKLSAGADAGERHRTSSRAYDRNGNVVSSTDGEGRETRIDYTPMDQPRRVVAPGRTNRTETTQYLHDDADRLVARVDPKGAAASPGAGDHQRICATDGVSPPAVAHMTRFCLDAGDRMLAKVRTATELPPNGGPNALIESFAYDGRGNVTGMVDPARNAGRTVRQAIDQANVADAGTTRRRFTYEYNEVDELTARIEHLTEADSGGRVPAQRTGFEYDANGNRTAVLPPRAFAGRTAGNPDRGYATETFYDHRDQEAAVRTPAGCTAYGRRQDGRITSLTTPRGTGSAPHDCSRGTGFKYHTTRFEYDAQGNLEWRTVPYAQGQYGLPDTEFEDHRVTYERDDVGNPTAVTDPRGHRFENTFYDSGELRSTERPSWYELDWGEQGHETADPARRFGQARSGGDFELADGGPRLREVESMSRNARRSGEDPELPEGGGQGDFAEVDPQEQADMLPDAGRAEFAYDDEMRLTSVTDAAGGAHGIEYDEAGRVTRKSWPFKPDARIERRFEYDLNGNLERYLDGRGHETTYGYDGFDRRIREATPGSASAPGDEPEPETTHLAYDPNGNVEWRQTPRGSAFRFHFEHDSADRMVEEANPAGERWAYAYDPHGNVTRERSPRYHEPGVTKSHFERTLTYDTADRLTRDQPGFGDGFAEHVYDAEGNVTSATSGGAAASDGGSAERRRTQTAYDGRGLPWRETTGTAGGEDRRTTIREYDANGNLRRVVSGKGVRDHTAPKVLGTSATSTTNLTWHATLREYDGDDQLEAVRLPWSKPSGAGSPAVDDPQGPTDAEAGGDDRRFVQRFQRAAEGNPLKRVTSIVSPPAEPDDTKAARTSYTYWENGWVRTQSDEKVVLRSRTEPVGTVNVSYDYDREGNQIEWRTQEARESPDGRLVKRSFHDDGTLMRRVAYKTKEGTNDQTRRTYDYFYNANRSLVRIDDFDSTAGPQGRARSTTITRDDAEREKVVNEAWDGGKDTVFEYDRNGNVTTRKTDGKYVDASTYTGDERKTTTFEYDPLDRETRGVATPAEGSARTTTTTWWNSNDMRTRTKPNGTVESYFYNARGEMARKLRDPAQGATQTQDYDYDRDGNRVEDERGDHVFNPRGQLVRWTRGPKFNSADGSKDKDGTVVTYERNGSGDIKKKTDTFKPPTITGDTTTSFRYQGERLIWSETSRPTLIGTQTTHSDYSYDDFGSVTKIVHEQSGPGADPPDPPSGPPTAENCTEISGPAEANVTRYCYDEFERMVQSRGAGVETPTRYVYDGLDRRDRKTITESGTARNHDYAYVGLTELLSRETDKDQKRKTYDYDSDGRRLGQSVKTSGDAAPTHRPFATDANGTVEGLEDTQGRFGVLDRDTYLYDPYGESENVGLPTERDDPGLTDAAKDNPFRFQGFYFDSGVKTYDMQARSYRPEIGRFLSQDRYEAALGDQLLQADPLTQNRYAFAGGNPVNNVEFDGHIFPPFKNVARSGGRRRAAKRAASGARARARGAVAARAAAGGGGAASGAGAGVAAGGRTSAPRPKPPRLHATPLHCLTLGASPFCRTRFERGMDQARVDEAAEELEAAQRGGFDDFAGGGIAGLTEGFLGVRIHLFGDPDTTQFQGGEGYYHAVGSILGFGKLRLAVRGARKVPGWIRNAVKGNGKAAPKGGLSWAEKSGILRDAARHKGPHRLGSATSREADALGRDWVGEGYKVARDGRTLVSSDGLRQYRPPTFKPDLGRYQANLERRFEGQRSREWQGNGHLDITDLP